MMQSTLLTASISFAVALVVALVCTRLMIPLAKRWGIINYPGYRRYHARPTPTMGGIGIALGIGAGLITALIIEPDTFSAYHSRFMFLGIGSLIILATGAIDDRKELSPRLKLLGQLIATTVLVIGGFRMENLSNPFGENFDLGWLSYPMTYLWIVGLTNAINLSDGLDGFAAGIVAIAAGSIAIVALIRSNDVILFSMLAVTGAAIGFLFFNFPPARIFMGDTGALFLGFMLAGLTTMERIKGPVTVTLVIPILALGIPLIDTVLAMLRRLVARSTIARGDAHHIHHRMLEMGLNPRVIDLTAYAITALLGLAAISIYLVPKPYRLFILFGVIVIILVFLFLLGGLKLLYHKPEASNGERSPQER